MNFSLSSGMKHFYDDAGGTPIDITAFVMTNNDILDEKNVLQQTDGYGTKMPEYDPSGRGTIAVIELGGMYKTGLGSIDALFANRIPEDNTAVKRTYTCQYLTGRTVSVETHLLEFKRTPNKDNGLTKFTVQLQPTGERTEVIP